jgi:hypothetical protein
MIAMQAASAASPVQTHPVYRLWETTWRKLAHTYEGSGGYLDGTYLVAHPREWEDYNQAVPVKPTKKLLARRALARYENVAAAILDAKKAALFREQPTRLIGGKTLKDADHPLRHWWSNVDGAGCAIDDWMQEVMGAVGHLRPHRARHGPAAAGGAAADEGRPGRALSARLHPSGHARLADERSRPTDGGQAARGRLTRNARRVSGRGRPPQLPATPADRDDVARSERTRPRARPAARSRTASAGFRWCCSTQTDAPGSRSSASRS